MPPGLGHATPIVWDDKIFVLTAVPSRKRKRLAFTLSALDRPTGKTLWSKMAREGHAASRNQPTNSHASGSPVTDGERLLVSFGSYGLYCFDFDGNLVWENIRAKCRSLGVKDRRRRWQATR